MSIKKIIVLLVIGSIQTAHSGFQTTIGYTFFFPAKSTWGLFDGKGVTGSVLAQSPGVASLKESTVNNNNGNAGVLKGSISEIQIVPSLPAGVTYWNPLSIINSIQPCLLETFIPNAQQLSAACQSPEVLMIDKQKISSSTGITNDLDKKFAALSSLSDKAFQREYQLLYESLKSNLTNLMTIKNNVHDDPNFYSALYLKFASTYGGQFINQAALEKAQNTLFSNDTDVSTYFKEAVFPVVADLTNSADSSLSLNQNSISGNSSTFISGPLVRALGGSNIDMNPLLTQVSWQNFSAVQKFLTSINNASVGMSVYNRARLTELFFLYLGILMGSNIVAGAPTYDKAFCADSSCPGNSWCPVPAPCEKMNIMPFSFYSISSHQCFAQMCSKLAAAARYVALLHDATTKNKYACQPVDRFYGMIVLNQSSYTISSDTTLIKPGQVGVLKASPGVDMWNATGINPDSNYKYRSVLGNLLKDNQSKSIELRVEENFDSKTYDVSKTYVPGITICNGITKTQRDIVSKGYLENFFKVDSAVGWAVVLQIAEPTATDGTSSIVFNMVGLARLNSYDFPLVYRAPGLEASSVGAFSATQLWQAPFVMYTKIVASSFADSQWKLCSTSAPQLSPLGTITIAPFTITLPGSTSTKTLTPSGVNPYYISYMSALNADYGSKVSLKSLLASNIDTIKKSYFTLQDLNATTLISLVTKASENPHDTIVQITTTQDYRLTN